MRHADDPHIRPAGISPHALGNDTLLHELEQLHRTRHETFLYGSEDAQAGSVGTRHTSHDYGLKSGDGYHAYRPVNLS
ncbi:DUF6158 family protein, partial [Kitasatospora sp. NPDC004799]|uniref:DUF6158 family protein n=1 Tax=Kitasatospora sp. NPDC004799 TaxID=3154460 RepID=UPI0033A146B1